MQPDSVLHILLGEYVFAAAAAVAVTPAWPLPRPALKINLLASPFALQSLSLPLPAAPHRGVFRGADVTVHVTAPSGPGLSMYREPKESQEYQAILCSLSGVARCKSIQVPERHGYPHTRTPPSTYGMGTERLQGMYRVHIQHRLRGSSRASRFRRHSISFCSSQQRGSCSHPAVTGLTCSVTQSESHRLTDHCRIIDARRSAEGEREHQRGPCRRRHNHRPARLGSAPPVLQLPPTPVAEPVEPRCPPGSFSFSLDSGEPHNWAAAPKPVDPGA